MEDMRIRTLLDDTFTKADLEIVLKASAEGNVKVSLSKDGKTLMTEESSLGGETELVMKVDKPQLWSAESPALYDLLFQVYDKAGNLKEVIPYRVGFRRFEMKDSIMTLTGKRVVFKGVNRHEFDGSSIDIENSIFYTNFPDSNPVCDRFPFCFENQGI